MQFIAKKPKRCSPLMNRGYYARVKAIEAATHQFLKAQCSQPKQIVVLGGGMDTLFFKLKQAGLAPRRFVEVDFPEVVMQKKRLVASAPILRKLAKYVDHIGPRFRYFSRTQK